MQAKYIAQCNLASGQCILEALQLDTNIIDKTI